MMPVADRILTLCETAIEDGRVDDARKLARSLGVMTGNPAWERAYRSLIDGENTFDQVKISRSKFDAAELGSLSWLLHSLHNDHGEEFPNQSVRGGTQVNLTHDEDIRALLKGEKIIGIWSTRLQKGGHHIPHIHPQGGMSHVLYLNVPDAGGGHLYFGVSRYSTRKPAHVVVPKPGMLVSFPNWLWHGVTPYLGDKPRLALAWDTENG